jgi:hypothetical protein
MVEGMTNDGWTHPPPGIQIQAMPVKVGNVSLFSGFLLAGHFLSFLFDRIFPTNPSPSPNHKMSG